MKYFLYFFSYINTSINKRNGNIISSGSGHGTFNWVNEVNASNVQDFLGDLKQFITDKIKQDARLSSDDVEIQVTIINYKYMEDVKYSF